MCSFLEAAFLDKIPTSEIDGATKSKRFSQMFGIKIHGTVLKKSPQTKSYYSKIFVAAGVLPKMRFIGSFYGYNAATFSYFQLTCTIYPMRIKLYDQILQFIAEATKRLFRNFNGNVGFKITEY